MLPRPQRLIRTSLPIAPLLVHPRAPPPQPPQPPPPGVQEAKKHHHDPKRQPGVQRRGQRHRVLAPPRRGALAQSRVEGEADEGPDGEVEACGGGDPAQASEEDGQVDVAPCAAGRGAAAHEPDEDRGDEADGEAPDEGSVEGVLSEEAVGADDAPEDAAVEVDAGEGAGEVVEGGWGAEGWDVGDGPV